MTRLERFKAERDRIQALVNAYTRRCAIAPPKLAERLKDLNEAIAEMEEADRSRPISELLTKEQIAESGLVDMITEIHLASDFLARSILDFVDRCRKYGLEINDVTAPAIRIVQEINSFVDPLMRKNEWLEETMTCNEYLSDAIHKKIQSFINQRKSRKQHVK